MTQHTNKLLDSALAMARKHKGQAFGRRCAGLDTDALIGLVEAAVAPEDRPILEEIVGQIEEYGNRPARKLPSGETAENVHGFILWIEGLHAGWATLPERIPTSVLSAWRNGYAKHPADGTPIPIVRCDGCHMALPVCAADGRGDYIRPCPVCGSSRIAHMRLWAWGTFWPISTDSE